jgi:hypothetical protein
MSTTLEQTMLQTEPEVVLQTALQPEPQFDPQSEPQATGDPSDPVLHAVSDLISDIRAKVVAELTWAGQAESPRLRDAIAAMRESIRGELCEKLRSEFETRFHESMEIAKRQFMEKLLQATASAEDERNRLREEITANRKRAAEISAELLSKQSELEHMNRETPAMLENPDIDLAKIVHHKAIITELSAYLKGLKYLSGE